MTESANNTSTGAKASTPQKPRRLIANRYEVVNKLMGGMGIVYLCRDQRNNQLVALKTFKPEFLSHLAARDLFLREGTMWVEMGRHPNIVQAYRVERIGDGREVYLVLEWIVQPKGKKSPSLRSWLRHGNILPPEQALLFALHIARGMRYATQKIPGLVHRDIKPENILIGHDGVARVTDFGLASTLSGLQNTQAGILANAKENFGRTQLTQGVAGTPLYMAPEQWMHSQLDARADIYALGCILYEMITGQFAAQGENREQLKAFHLSGRIKPPPEGTSHELLSVLRKCLVSQRERRYRGWREAEESISEAYERLTGEPPPPLREASSETREDRIVSGYSYNTMGLSYLDIGKLDVAVMYFEQAVNVGRAEASEELEGTGLGNLGLAYMALGYLERAIDFHEEHLAIARKTGDRAEEGKALGRMGHVYLRMGDVTRAIGLHERELAIFQNVGDRFKEAMALHSLGDVYRRLSEIDRAVEFYKKSLAIAQDIGDKTRVERILNSMGLVYLDSGEAKEAVALFQQAFEIAHEIGDRVGEGEILANMGDLYRSLKYSDRAIEQYHRALAIAQDSNDRRKEIRNLISLGDLYLEDLRNAEEAEANYSAALEAVQDTGDIKQEMFTYIKLGTAYNELGDFMQTASLAKRALDLAKDYELPVLEREALGMIGAAYEKYGDAGRAIEYYEKSRAISEELAEKEPMFVTMEKLALLYRRTNQLKLTVETYQELLVLIREQKDYAREGETLNWLGDISRAAGDYKQAMIFYKEALTLARDKDLRQVEALSYSSMGLVHNDQGNKWRSTWHLDKAIATAKKSKKPDTLALANYRMALVLCKQDKWDKAQPFCNRAGELYTKLRDGAMLDRVRKMKAEITRQLEKKGTGFFS
ncbi:MAG: tetratricopeptide repeat protein [Anaerolineales bacterium]|nr:tetratricopeptide repeat protein [Anaerolineales bacterium]